MPGIGYDYYKSKKNGTLTSLSSTQFTAWAPKGNWGEEKTTSYVLRFKTTPVFCQTKFSPSRSSEINVENKLLQFFVKENMG